MPSPILLNISNNISVKEIPIVGEKFLIGRGLHNEFIVEDVNVSRTHCSLEQEGSDWLLMDKSSNGTWLNGKLIEKGQKHKLTTGDVIGLNIAAKFVFKIVGDERDNIRSNNEDYTSENNHLSQDHNYAQITKPVNALEGTMELKIQNIAQSVSSQDNIKTESIEHKERSQPTNLDYVEDELQCSICAELFVQAVTLSCSHTFCSFCIGQWRKTQSICPICRSKITSMCPTRVIDGFIEKVLENADEETKRIRREMIEQRQTTLATSANSTNSASTSTRSSSRSATSTGSVPSTSTASTRSTRRNASAAPIEISSDEDNTENANEEDDGISDYSGSDWERDYGDDEWFDDYNGLPGQYYGGYGRCYVCGQRGHWANGCPNKRR